MQSYHKKKNNCGDRYKCVSQRRGTIASSNILFVNGLCMLQHQYFIYISSISKLKFNWIWFGMQWTSIRSCTMNKTRFALDLKLKLYFVCNSTQRTYHTDFVINTVKYYTDKILWRLNHSASNICAITCDTYIFHNNFCVNAIKINAHQHLNVIVFNIYSA